MFPTLKDARGEPPSPPGKPTIGESASCSGIWLEVVAPSLSAVLGDWHVPRHRSCHRRWVTCMYLVLTTSCVGLVAARCVHDGTATSYFDAHGTLGNLSRWRCCCPSARLWAQPPSGIKRGNSCSHNGQLGQRRATHTPLRTPGAVRVDTKLGAKGGSSGSAMNVHTTWRTTCFVPPCVASAPLN